MILLTNGHHFAFIQSIACKKNIKVGYSNNSFQWFKRPRLKDTDEHENKFKEADIIIRKHFDTVSFA